MTREDKTHPAGQPAQVHSCADCGRTAVLTIFRNEGLCHSCRTARDVEVVKGVADKERLPTRQSVMDAVNKEVARQVVDEAFPPDKPFVGILSLMDEEVEIVPETVIYCDRCATHRVAEVGQVCPVCNGHRG